jgi:23S rRNA pseudouridine1911/1915/1917 synthase
MIIPVLYEDNEILVVNKPAGIPSQPDKSGTSSLLEILSENHPNLFVIHRLDQRVSGIIVLAKTEVSAAELSKDFQTRNVAKKYRAIVANQPKEKEGKLTHWLLKDTKKNLSKAFEKEVKNSQKAELKYETVTSSERYHLLEIELFTGRFHQIRSQLSAMGCPIFGDLKYGYKRSSPDGSIFLQSYFLSFNHPKTKQALQFEIEMPELWKKYGF